MPSSQSRVPSAQPFPLSTLNNRLLYASFLERFLVDEDVAIEVGRCLRRAGYEVPRLAEVLGVRTDDVDIWDHAVRTAAIVITCNRQDFLELAGTEPETGLIVLNRRRTRQAECRHLLHLVTNAGDAGLERNINFA